MCADRWLVGWDFGSGKLLLGSLFTGKTSVWMNLSPCISAGLSPIASFSTAQRRSLQLGFSPGTLSWCLGSVVCVSVIPVAAAAQRSQLPLPQHQGLPVAGHSQEDAEGKHSPSDASTAVWQRWSLLTLWR